MQWLKWTSLSLAIPGALLGCSGDEVDLECSPYDEVYVYVDEDGDGFGSTVGVGYVCTPTDNEATNNVDCDDANPAVNPGAEEVCDLEDNDCNGLVDESHPKVPWYPDEDGDGYGGDAQSESSCLSPGPTFTQISGDCNDNDPVVNPLAREVCNNGADDDCDGRADDQDEGVDPSTRITYYRDRDRDTYGDPETSVRRCAAPANFVNNALDCDDRNETINPEGAEVCDNIDNDCDTLIDDFDGDPDHPLNGTTSTVDPSGQLEFFADTDCDGWGDP
nr:putative metal-binding motif-containing protein [Myxococcales bacterium]